MLRGLLFWARARVLHSCVRVEVSSAFVTVETSLDELDNNNYPEANPRTRATLSLARFPWPRAVSCRRSVPLRRRRWCCADLSAQRISGEFLMNGNYVFIATSYMLLHFVS